MSPQRWWSVILTMGLFMALGPLSAQAGPNRPFAPQPNRQAFTPPQSRGNVFNQARQVQPPRANVFGQAHQGMQPRGNAHGWNAQNRQWQQPRGNANGWYGQNRQWNQHRNAYGRDEHRRQWDRDRNAYGRNEHQGPWQQRGPSVARPGNRQFQPSKWGQLTNPGPVYNRASYPAQPQSPTVAPGSPGYSPHTTSPAGQTGSQPGFRHPGAAGNTPQPQSPVPAGVI